MKRRPSSLVALLDPTHPSRWARRRASGQLAFVLGWGVIGTGLPLALLLQRIMPPVEAPIGPFGRALLVLATLFAVAPMAGAVVGNILWSRGERRYAEMTAAGDVHAASERESADPGADDLEPDDEQRRLTALSESLERLAIRDPAALRRRVNLYAALGYGYILLLALSLIGLVVLLLSLRGPYQRLAAQGAWLVGVFTFFLLSSLRVRLQEPQGRRITAAGSPRLFEAIERIRHRFDAPTPDVVVVDAELNAAVAELPRWGIIGVPRRHLVVGLPLLEAFPADEAEAILAHELGHLSRRHGRRAVWLGRLAISWTSLAIELESGRHWARPLLLPFFRWFAPRFELHAQILSRQDEHESDALAAEHAGTEVTARALLRLHLLERLLTRRVLPAIRRDTKRHREPPRGGLATLVGMLREGPSREETVSWLRATLAERTLVQHSHPSLADRIAALGLLPRSESDVQRLAEQLAAPASSAADSLLGKQRASKLREQLDQRWQTDQADAWRRWHADAAIWQTDGLLSTASDDPGATARDGIASLRAAPLEALWARARWAADCEPPEVAIPIARAVLERQPSHSAACTILGRLLLQSDTSEERAEGARLLESVVRRDSAEAIAACEALQAYYGRLGWREDLERMQWRERQLQMGLMRSLRERHSLSAGDVMIPYPVPAPTREALGRACASRREVSRAYLVRKRTRYFREQPLVVLALEYDVAWYKPADGAATSEACMALLERLVLPEEADTLVVAVPPRSALRRRLRSLEGAEVYRRTR